MMHSEFERNSNTTKIETYTPAGTCGDCLLFERNSNTTKIETGYLGSLASLARCSKEILIQQRLKLIARLEIVVAARVRKKF